MTDFIGEYYLEDTTVCDELVELFNTSKTHEGICGNKVNKQIKESTDYSIYPEQFHKIEKYFKELQKICDKYSEEYIWCDKYAPWSIIQPINIQHYKPNQGYYAWHAERTCGEDPFRSRHLVFTTYLNDVEDQGETEFYYQKTKVKPKKGKTIIFPADWTHTHRGVVSPTQDKYIITGWFDFILGDKTWQ